MADSDGAANVDADSDGTSAGTANLLAGLDADRCGCGKARVPARMVGRATDSDRGDPHGHVRSYSDPEAQRQ